MVSSGSLRGVTLNERGLRHDTAQGRVVPLALTWSTAREEREHIRWVGRYRNAGGVTAQIRGAV